MHRSSSTTRISDEFSSFKNSLSSSSSSSSISSLQINGRSSVDGSGISSQLPVYNPISHVAKRERSRLRSAENTIHFIPLVLLICTIILWVFSNPVDVVKKAESTMTTTEILKTVGGVDIDGTQNNMLAHLELEDIDPTRRPADRKSTEFRSDEQISL